MARNVGDLEEQQGLALLLTAGCYITPPCKELNAPRTDAVIDLSIEVRSERWRPVAAASEGGMCFARAS